MSWSTQPLVRRGSGWPVWVVALALGAVYVEWAPHTADLAAQTARADLFRRSGLVPYWTAWYSGLPTADYSLTTPALLGWIGPVWLGALSILATAAVAVPLLRDARRPRAGAVFFALAAGLDVGSGRTTFAVGLVVALAAALAAHRRRPVAGLLLAVLATVTSPVAGLLLLVPAAALVLAGPQRRRSGLATAAGALVALVVLDLLARGAGSGYEPLSTSSLIAAVATALILVVLPVGRLVRAGAMLTIALLLVVYSVHSAVGANATRIAVLGTAPALVASLRSRSGVVLVGFAVLASLLPLAQLHNDLAAARPNDGSRAFVEPLVSRLSTNPNERVELVDTATHWPSTYLLPTVALARGWERQVDEARNPMFYGRAPLTAGTYRAFLDRNAVDEVAVAQGVPLDYGATREAALIRGGLPYLREVWSNASWRLYAVSAPAPVVAAPARVTAQGDTGVSVRAPRAGDYLLRLEWSPYLGVTGGRVRRGPAGQTELDVARAGTYRIHAVWRWP